MAGGQAPARGHGRRPDPIRRGRDLGRGSGVPPLAGEHVWHHVSPVKRGPKELTGMVDLTRDEKGKTRARLLDLAPGRSGREYLGWLQERGEAFTAGVTIATLDPFRGTRTPSTTSCRTRSPSLMPFTLVKFGGQAVDEVRPALVWDGPGSLRLPDGRNAVASDRDGGEVVGLMVVCPGWLCPEAGKLTGKRPDESVTLFPPFHYEFGKNLTLGKDVFINLGCRFQDTGGITVGDGTLIGHGATLTTLNHSIDPDRRADMTPAPDSDRTQRVARSLRDRRAGRDYRRRNDRRRRSRRHQGRPPTRSSEACPPRSSVPPDTAVARSERPR